MTDAAYEEFMRRASSYTEERNQDAWTKWSLVDLPRFDWDQEPGQIIFTGPQRKAVVADVQFVGYWSRRARTWMWAWANDSVLESMRREVQEVREFGRSNGLRELTEPVWEGPLEAGWDMTSLSCYILRSDMGYRAPDSGDDRYTFLSLRNLRLAGRRAEPVGAANSHPPTP